MQTEIYTEQIKRWPQSGWHILAQYDDHTVTVYQAYRPAIGHFAAEHGYFGGEFSLNRMTWIKPNFLWMMYRSGWGQKPGQEVILAVRLERTAFDELLSGAVPSSFDTRRYASRDEWKEAVRTSDVRLQWDPDHDPAGNKVERRAIQLGLRGQATRSYARDWIVDISDLSGFVAEQRRAALNRDWDHLSTPREEVYTPAPEIQARLGMGDEARR